MTPQPAAIVCSLVLITVAAIAFDRYCLNDLARADVLVYFPRFTWTTRAGFSSTSLPSKSVHSEVS